MSDEDNKEAGNASEAEASKPPVHPLAVGYWSHAVVPVLLVVINLVFMVGLLKASHSVYLHANSVSGVTPAKRLDAVQETAESGRAELVRTIASLGIGEHFKNISGHLETHRTFYRRMLRSDEDFSKLMHLQQNGVSHFAAIIGQSEVWQQRYTQRLMPLPVNSAKRQLIIRQTMSALQELPTLAD